MKSFRSVGRKKFSSHLASRKAASIATGGALSRGGEDTAEKTIKRWVRILQIFFREWFNLISFNSIFFSLQHKKKFLRSTHMEQHFALGAVSRFVRGRGEYSSSRKKIEDEAHQSVSARVRSVQCTRIKVWKIKFGIMRKSKYLHLTKLDWYASDANFWRVSLSEELITGTQLKHSLTATEEPKVSSSFQLQSQLEWSVTQL